jgi:ATP-dependent Clp protease protease subunit
MSRMVIPTVTEQTAQGERSFDIYSRLLRDRIVFVGDEISDDLANIVNAQLLFLDNEDPDKDISMYINSPGGSVTAAMSMYDTMQYVHARVSTICLGMAASGGSLLLAAGAPGRRMSLPNGLILIHQPWASGMQGQAGDLEIHAREILRQRDVLIDIYAKHAGKTRDVVAQAIDRDNFMTAEQAKTFGLIDGIVESRPKAVAAIQKG